MNHSTSRMTQNIIVSTVAALALTASTGSVVAADPYAKADDTWITLSGKVDSVSRDSFVLNYDQGRITVEMDDGDRDADGYKLVSGDQVTVSGRIDDDFFETTTIEAYSVYVNDLNTTFYASAVDEEDSYFYSVYYPMADYRYNLVGTVTDVNVNDFFIDTGSRRVRVEVSEMSYNPLDDEGYQKIEVGDRVSVSGDVEYDIFEGREVDADTIIKLHDANLASN